MKKRGVIILVLLVLMSFVSAQSNVCIGDFNLDGNRDFPDFLLFVQEYSKSHALASIDARFDLDSNGVVGFSDFMEFARYYNQGCGSEGVVGISDVTLGDVDLNGCVDNKDVKVMETLLQNPERLLIKSGVLIGGGSSLYSRAFDLNLDFRIDDNDLEIIRNNLGKGCESFCLRHSSFEDRNGCYITLAAKPAMLNKDVCSKVSGGRNWDKLQILCRKKVEIGRRGLE